MTLQERLTDAEAAYHALMTGQMVAEVRDQNGETIRYSKGEAASLRAYIADLKSQLGTEGFSGPLRLVF